MIFDFSPWQLDADVDLTKVEVEKTIYEILEDEETSASKIYRMFVNFLIRGKIMALPKYQKDFYCDEEYLICPHCEQEVYKKAILCSFC